MNVNGGVNDFSAFLSDEAVDATLKLVKDQVGEDIYSLSLIHISEPTRPL